MRKALARIANKRKRIGFSFMIAGNGILTYAINAGPQMR
jgi:hypothetical protein